MNIIVAKWMEINLGDTTSSGSDTILRYAIDGPDVLYDGQNFPGGTGDLVDIGKITIPLGLEKTSMSMTFSSANLTLMAHFNQRKYLNHSTKVWMAERNTDGSIKTSSVEQIFEGFGDTHNLKGEAQLVYRSASQFSRFEQLVGNTTSSSNQKFNIQNSLYPGIPTTTVDKGFDHADDDFGGLILGKVPARTIQHEQIQEGAGGTSGGQEKYQFTDTEYIPGADGQQLSDNGSDYTRPIVFGGGHVKGNLIYALNPTLSVVTTAYPGMEDAEVIKDVTDTTRFATMLFAVAEGELENMGVLFGELEDGSEMDTAYLREGYKNYVKDSSGNIVAAIEFKAGSYDQTSLTTLTAFDPNWTNNHRCLGTALVLITLVASPAFAGGFPQFTFIVGGKKHKVVTKTGEVYALADTFGYTETVSTLYGRLDSQVPWITELSDNNVPNSASPAFVVLDLLMSEVYGLGIPVGQIDLKSFYDSYQNEIDRSNSQVGAYDTVCRGVLAGAQTAKQRLDQVLAVAKANLCVIDGKILLIHNKYLGTDASVIASSEEWNESTFIDGIRNLKFSPTSKTFNTIDITAPVSNSLNPEEFRTKLVDTNALAAADGKESKRTLNLAMASVEFDVNGNLMDSSGEVLAEIGRIILRRSQVYVTGSGTVSYWDHKNLIPGDVRTLNSRRLNFTGTGKILIKPIRITIRGLGDMDVDFAQFSSLIYDNSSSDITEVTRGIFPVTSFSAPDTFNNDGAAGADGSYNITVYQDATAKPSISGGTPSTTSRTELAVLPSNWLGDPTPGDVLQRWKAVTSIDPVVIAAGDKQEKATFTEDPLTVTGGSLTLDIAQINTTLYNSGTSGNASGSTTVAEEGFLDIDGDFPAANYPVTRDSLKATFSVGSETEFNFDNFEVDQSYSIDFSGFTFPATATLQVSRILSDTIGFTIGGGDVTHIEVYNYTGFASHAENVVSFSGTRLYFTSTTATSESELASQAATALQAISDSSGTSVVNTFTSSETSTVVRSVDVSSDGDDLTLSQRGVGTYSDATISNNGPTSTISNVTGVYRPRNDGFAVTLSGFTFPLTTSQERTNITQTSGPTGFTIDGTEASGYRPMSVGTISTSTFLRTDELVVASVDGFFYLSFLSTTATSEAGLASEAATAYGAISNSGTTTLNHTLLSDSTTYEVKSDYTFESDGDKFLVTRFSAGEFSDATLDNTTATSTVENFAYVPTPNPFEYFELDLSGFTFPASFTSRVSQVALNGSNYFTRDGSSVLGVSIGTSAEYVNDEVVYAFGSLLFYSSTATTETQLASQAATAFQALALTSSGSTTTIKGRDTGSSTTYEVSRSMSVSSDGATLKFTHLTSGDKVNSTLGTSFGGPTSTFENFDYAPVIPLPDYSTTALVAARIVDQGYEGVTLTVDNTYDIIANPLGAGDVRIKFVYDALGTQTDVTSASFVVEQGTDGTLTLEEVGIVTQGGGVTHVGDTLALTNVDTANGHSASAANVTLANTITGDTVQDAIGTLWSGLGGFTIDKTTSGTVLATDTAAGDSSDPVLVHTPGTGSTLVISSSVTTQGVDGGVATGTNTNTTTVAGVDYLTVFGVGIAGSARATAVYNTLNAAAAVTDDYNLVIDGDTWSIERKIFGNQTDVTSVIDTGKLNQTAVDPTVVRIQGVLTALVWTDPVEDGELVIADGISILKDDDGTLSVGEISSSQVTVNETYLGAIQNIGSTDLSFSYGNSIRYRYIHSVGRFPGTSETHSSSSDVGDYTVVVSVGNITIDFDLTSIGGDGAYFPLGNVTPAEARGGAGGDISLTATTGNIIIKGSSGIAIKAEGGDGQYTLSSSASVGGDGGDAGNITLSAPLGCIMVSGSETATAGDSPTSGSGTNGTGGDAGIITKNNVLGNACIT